MMKIRTIMLFTVLLFYGAVANAQDKKSVTGTVKSSQGAALSGVTVSVVGSKSNAQTDKQGSFKIEVASLNETLQFTFVGYASKEVSLSGRNQVNVSLDETAESLDEVVVVGYGTQKKSNLTASVDVISSAQLKDRPANNVADLIKGASPNVNVNMGMRGGEPGASSAMNIRGVGSINGNASPLVLVDGVEMDLGAIDPETVENISVLKDASAAAVYGSRAPFGVILITTKRGSRQEGVKLDYSNNLSLSSPLRLPSFIDSYTWATAFNQANANAGLTPVYSDEQMQRIKGYLDGTFPYEYDPEHPIDNIWAGRRNGNANNDWPHLLMGKNAFSQKHNLNVTGGSQRTQYFLSSGYSKQNGTYAFGHDDFKRYNLMSNVSTEVTDWLKIGSNLKWATSSTDFPMGETTVGREHTFREMLMFAPMMPHYNINGTVQSPLVRLLQDSGRDKSKKADFLANLNLELEPIKGWKTIATYSYNIRNVKSTSNPKPVMVELGTGAFGNIGKPNASYTSGYSEEVYKVFNVVSSYEKQLSDHYFKILMGFEQEENLYTGLTTTGVSPVVDDNPSIVTSLGGITSSDKMNHWATRGAFGRLNYNFQEKYLVEVAARYNGSSRFPKDNRFDFFPSASVGYVLSKEDYWSTIKPYINDFKVRVSYGSLGNQNVPINKYVSRIPIRTDLNWIINSSRPQYGGAPELISDNITWETITTLNAGVDLQMLNSKLDFKFDWYNRITDKMLGDAIELPYVLGAATPFTNNAKLSTKGFEMVIGWNDKLSNGLSYNFKLALGDSRTKILEYLNEDKIFTKWYSGKSHGEIWGLETGGIIQSVDEKIPDQKRYHANWGPGDIRYVDQNGDGVINDGKGTVGDPGDFKVIGNTTPRYNIGISAGASWKGIDFSMFWQGVAKRDFAPQSSTPLFWGMTNAWANSGLYKNSPALDYWRPADETNILGPNTDAYLPKPYFTAETEKNRLTQTRYLLNASYIRLKNVQVGYTLPNEIGGKLFSRARVYFSGENLLTFSKLPKVFDPETAIASDSREGGYLTNGVIYPMNKIVSFGLNVTLK
ncbi:SusC/RagA family TonB-linked outer membrane protein [Sphingobacterium yanglingense]|uniref:TonB-linked SusC/RagA family outer membrane protein n=1 Tax=Sphingobacterium yanglingense TaxID=1437280 RepID=A0A4R6W907_9SPHI|nr:TonB-dependent receptor [Sphingobacterium yanglingense]TDQ73892.1 TonB-linked SusC/RagA family outer membrane protein [Sphingobacterium yanglingense]